MRPLNAGMGELHCLPCLGGQQGGHDSPGQLVAFEQRLAFPTDDALGVHEDPIREAFDRDYLVPAQGRLTNR